jgi:hypothetical protein
MPAPPEAWHLDKRVPIALILTVAIQTGAMVWWAASISARVEMHERQIASLQSAEIAAAAETRRISETLARLDERLAQQTAVLLRLERHFYAQPPRRDNAQ